MRYLKNKCCYLSGPITAANDDGVGWRQEITPKLIELGLKVYDPTTITESVGEVGKHKLLFKKLIKKRNFKKCKELFWPIARRDLRMVDLSDFLIFFYDPDLPMFGTVDEIVTASRLQKKPVLMYVPEEKITKINPWSLVLIKEECIFTDWNKLFKYLEKINKTGPKGSQTSYWTL